MAHAQTQYNSASVVEKGLSLGSVLAIVTSWSRNKSIGWAILHALLSWLYVFHFVITRAMYGE
ncbi:hypothetical protein ESB13_16960 [Filimonas effusa]|uniref:Uncharacterized protein n=1 Tax=Filimonas effusa TaxID=2508721 RepID=A0A4Q1D653_9BACT|nr:hypothetical protein ESB13_16960 [Filimonas effusa]